ncbi:META domain-containing protein [Bradyrhizobium sp. LHD-71]|uniref:META domain-containing protein n=1 Tax=Bradyrhizobium sp. LHD-71 TaxID=3072141 RepID=UPI0028100D01|nr:META domain-containing protein [Bradyrhizobium sp. LHD-71]MDQ8727273.1 META domain-containing protein [Bradyrhizobium sp. LHD-71]
MQVAGRRLLAAAVLVAMVAVATTQARATTPVGRWIAEDIRGRGVIDRVQSTIAISSDGSVAGRGGCNRLSGKAVIAGDSIRFGPVASTKMACAPAVMRQEQTFLLALTDVRSWRTEPARGKLILLDAAGRPIVVLAAT